MVHSCCDWSVRFLFTKDFIKFSLFLVLPLFPLKKQHRMLAIWSRRTLCASCGKCSSMRKRPECPRCRWRKRNPLAANPSTTCLGTQHTRSKGSPNQAKLSATLLQTFSANSRRKKKTTTTDRQRQADGMTGGCKPICFIVCLHCLPCPQLFT